MQLEKEIIVAIIQILPTLFGIVALLVLILVFRIPLTQRIIPRLTGLKILGVEITLLKESLDKVVAERKVDVSQGDRWGALKRAQHVLPVIQRARILWVDDEPQGNRQLVKVLFTLGANVDQAGNTEEALKLLRRHQYDVVVSDIKRQKDGDAGIRMAKRMWDEQIYRWTIFYVTDLKPGIPEHAFNITNRPDHLLHFIMDVLERERWSDVAVQ